MMNFLSKETMRLFDKNLVMKIKNIGCPVTCLKYDLNDLLNNYYILFLRQ